MPRGSQRAARHFASEQTLHQNDGDQDRQNVFKVGLDPLRHFGAAAGVALGGVFVEAPAPFGDTEQQINKAAARQQETPSPAAVRTWIQCYNAIREPYNTYGPDEIAAQIRALNDTGNTGGYMTWNAASSLDKYRYVSGVLN